MLMWNQTQTASVAPTYVLPAATHERLEGFTS